ncbi:MAG: NUDIX domain-containing protein [Bacteroidota bacterium]
MKKVRISVKAIIIKDGQLLVNHYRTDLGQEYYGLPGGGQNNGETLTAALVRECQEEISAQVSVGPLVYVRDYISQNHEFAKEGDQFHQMELMFQCELVSHTGLRPGVEPDSRQIGVVWLPLDSLDDYPLYPQILKSVLQKSSPEGAIYLGDIN